MKTKHTIVMVLLVGSFFVGFASADWVKAIPSDQSTKWVMAGESDGSGFWNITSFGHLTALSGDNLDSDGVILSVVQVEGSTGSTYTMPEYPTRADRGLPLTKGLSPSVLIPQYPLPPDRNIPL